MSRKKKQQEQLDKAMDAPVRNWVAKNNKHKGGKHKSKKDYDRKSLVRKLKQFIKERKWEN